MMAVSYTHLLDEQSLFTRLFTDDYMVMTTSDEKDFLIKRVQQGIESKRKKK